MDKVSIDNENLRTYIMFKLEKIENEFTTEELGKITEVVMNYEEEKENSVIFLNELQKLYNLNSITLRNGFIYNENYEDFLKLKKLNKIIFDYCDFEDVSLTTKLNLKELSFINCRVADYSFITAFNLLEHLTIINGNVEIHNLNKLNTLKYLNLSASNLFGNETININNLEELYIDDTNIKDFNFLNNLNNLKKVSIDRNQYNANKELFNNLIKKGVLVYEEGIDTIGGEDNEL